MTAETGLSFEDYIGAIEQESARLGVIVADVLDRSVPSCPEWTGRDLVDHVGAVFTFWTHQLTVGDPSSPHEPDREVPEGVDILEWLDEATGTLVTTLSDLGPDEPCWNWSAGELESGWVARRMALETAVHRYDGELTADEPTEIDARLAIDGIDERIEVHLRADVPDVPSATLGGSLCLSCADADAAWVVEVGGGRVKSRFGAGPASAVVRGDASELFLFTWNRVPLMALDLTGSRAVAEAWSRLPN